MEGELPNIPYTPIPDPSTDEPGPSSSCKGIYHYKQQNTFSFNLLPGPPDPKRPRALTGAERAAKYKANRSAKKKEEDLKKQREATAKQRHEQTAELKETAK